MLRKFLAMIPQEESHRSMWKNFLRAIALLTVAMMSALYSSSVGRDGRIIAAGVSALIALAISIWVGLRFVPRLAQGVDWHWLPFLSRYKVTQEGWVYFGAIVIVILAAINTSNNLLYMVLSALLAVLLLSGFLSALNFRFVNFDIRVPATCFANQPFPFSLQIKNEKQVFPTFSLHTEPLHENARLFEPLYFPFVQAGALASQSGEATLRRRGRYKIKALRVSSRYPFGFFSKDHDCDVASECVCFPAIIPHEQMDLSVHDVQGSNLQYQRGVGFDLYMIRDYVQSDSARHVHWKASAKTASLKTREYAAEEGDCVAIGFDRFGTPNDAEEFERLVSYAASLVFYFIRDGVEVAFISDEWRASYGASPASLDAILTYLAQVEPSPHAPLPDIKASAGAFMLSLRGTRRP